MKAARGLPVWVPGDCLAWSWFRRVEVMAARVVFPEPGMPDTAMRRRFDRGTFWNFSGGAVVSRMDLGYMEWGFVYPRFG